VKNADEIVNGRLVPGFFQPFPTPILERDEKQNKVMNPSGKTNTSRCENPQRVDAQIPICCAQVKLAVLRPACGVDQ
jgi:hypothetical protein